MQHPEAGKHNKHWAVVSCKWGFWKMSIEVHKLLYTILIFSAKETPGLQSSLEMYILEMTNPNLAVLFGGEFSL